MYYTALFSVLFLLVGGVVGWMAAEKYIALLLASQQPPHEFQDLIDNNPHPELFDAEGNLDPGEFIVINFPADFDPEKDSLETDRDEEEDDHGGHPPHNCQPRPRSPHRRARLAPCVSGPGQGTMKEEHSEDRRKKRKRKK